MKLIPTPSALCLDLCLGLLLAISIAPPVDAQAPTENSTIANEINAPSLSVGSLSPALKIDQWFKGEPLTEFAKDKFYVVEFWATWCAPCIKSMPHLNELAEHYSKDGLEIIAITTTDASNTADAIKKFVDERGKNFRFRFGVCESDAMSKAFMVAAGKQAIPCSFVIDRQGKIAYIGLPSDLDYVLSRIADGTWRGKEDLEELEKMNQSIGNVAQLAATDPQKAYEIISHIEKANPSRATSSDFAFAKVMVLCYAKKFDEAKSLLESMKPKSLQDKDWGGLALVAGTLASRELNPQGVHKDFVDALLSEIKTTASDAGDWQSLVQVAISFRLAGEDQMCRECFDAAIAKCPDIQTKVALKLAAARFQESPDDESNK